MLRMRSNDVTLTRIIVIIIISSSSNSLNWCLNSDSVCHIFRLNTGIDCAVPGGDESTSDFQNRYCLDIRFEQVAQLSQRDRAPCSGKWNTGTERQFYGHYRSSTIVT